MTAKEKDAAQREYRKLKKTLGRVPSSREFNRVFPKRLLERAFPEGRAYSNLLALEGDEASPFSSPKSPLAEILEKWGRLARKTLLSHGRLPIQSEWSHAGLRPTISGIAKSHNLNWSDLPAAFHEQFKDDGDWQDVLPCILIRSTAQESVAEGELCFVYLMKNLRNGRFKIGISKTPGFREKTLQSEEPQVELIAKKKYVNRKIAGAIEKALHSLYSHKNARSRRSEWFVLDEEDVLELRATLDN